MSNKRGLPHHLAGVQAQGIKLNEPIAQFEVGSMKNFNYLILNWAEKLAAVVDPQQEVEVFLRALRLHGFKLAQILLTHTHFDHTAGVELLVEANPEIEIVVGALDLHRLSRRLIGKAQIKCVDDGALIKLGKFDIKVLHTPGHSAGEMSYSLAAQAHVEFPYLFTGDTLFIRDCGRTDFPDGSNDQMFESIQKIKALPLNTVFLVGHHYASECATTLGEELETSPPFKVRSVSELAALP